MGSGVKSSGKVEFSYWLYGRSRVRGCCHSACQTRTVFLNKLKKEKSPKCHLKWIHKRTESAVKLLEARRMIGNPSVQCAQTS